MASQDAHLAQYRLLREDAFRESNSLPTRVETLFLAAYHLVDACAARENVHIGKHQHVRRELSENDRIFGARTEAVWREFQELETRIRPKFIYGTKWTEGDFPKALAVFGTLERLCLEVLR